MDVKDVWASLVLVIHMSVGALQDFFLLQSKYLGGWVFAAGFWLEYVSF